jgi:hypothetical protein
MGWGIEHTHCHLGRLPCLPSGRREAPIMRGVAAGKSDGTERLAAGGPQGSPDQPRFLRPAEVRQFHPQRLSFQVYLVRFGENAPWSVPGTQRRTGIFAMQPESTSEIATLRNLRERGIANLAALCDLRQRVSDSLDNGKNEEDLKILEEELPRLDELITRQAQQNRQLHEDISARSIGHPWRYPWLEHAVERFFWVIDRAWKPVAIMAALWFVVQLVNSKYTGEFIVVWGLIGLMFVAHALGLGQNDVRRHRSTTPVAARARRTDENTIAAPTV